ncbi:hypothetical protein [Buttiauxella sp.]|uniref:hypothetical protein n=1 Tax=Buttiauxella sp. TaxID=1972222 RepID=UPI003C750FE1
MAKVKYAKREWRHKRYLVEEWLRRVALTPALSPRRGRKPINPFSIKEREKTGQSQLLQGERENRSIPTPSRRARKQVSPFSFKEREKTD